MNVLVLVHFGAVARLREAVRRVAPRRARVDERAVLVVDDHLPVLAGRPEEAPDDVVHLEHVRVLPVIVRGRHGGRRGPDDGGVGRHRAPQLPIGQE